MTEHLHELPDPTSISRLDIIAMVLGKLDNETWTSPLDRARKCVALLENSGLDVVQSISMPREIR